MKILIACDSFKDALPAQAVCEAIERGLRKGIDSLKNSNKKAFEIHQFPLADGGEGTFDILKKHLNLKKIEITVNDPLFRPQKAFYGITQNLESPIAFIEMAQAAGLQLLTTDERNPMKTTTFGVGEMILAAIKNGAKEIVLAIGGSATNDAGMGMAAALGYQFLDEDEKPFSPIGENLIKVHHIIPPSDFLTFPSTRVICDVTNPLFGRNGAAHVYARQKGATDNDIQALDDGLKHFSKVIEKMTPSVFHSNLIDKDNLITLIAGAGAAGGLGFGAMVFLNAELQSGIDVILNLTHFDDLLKQHQFNWIITGEGKLDSQTAHGKVVQGVACRARHHHVSVIALCGSLDMPISNSDDETHFLLDDWGITAAFSINPQLVSLQDALAATSENLESVAFNVMRLLGV